MLNFLKLHKWKVVAIDYSFSWKGVYTDSKDNHVLVYEVCERTGQRRAYCDDKDESAKKFGENRTDIERVKQLWIHKGKIKQPKDDKDIEWFDGDYAPLGVFNDLMTDIQNNSEIQELRDQHKLVDDAINQLDVAIKLSRK